MKLIINIIIIVLSIAIAIKATLPLFTDLSEKRREKRLIAEYGYGISQ